MSAEAAKAGFEAIRQYVQSHGEAQEKKATIVIATVKGDIHDIGKNIVKVLLENYGYEVIDLGKDVPPEKIVETVVDKHAPLVGLSALMTTTVVNMEESIKELHKRSTMVQDHGWRSGADTGICRHDRGRFLWKRCHAVCILCRKTSK